jgi:serine/threonine protein kinase/formylglycine-generating enzyme required for sulfatase activity
MTADKNNDQDHTVLRRSPAMGAHEPAPASGPAKSGETDAVWINPDLVSAIAAASAGNPKVGDLLGGRYRLERELGAGGMGIVYLASDQEVRGELFAIKVLKPEIRAHPESLALLREEVRTTRALRRDTIVGVYSLHSDQHDIFMLMEYLEGKTLDALLTEEFARGMPFARAWPLIEDICDGLAYAHDHNVIHSDLKPSNVFVTTSGRAKLLDFGIARAARMRAGRFDPGAVGALTVAYASSEMLTGNTPDHKDDIYGLGCIIYEMLSGKHPFGSRSAGEARRLGLAVPRIPSLTAAQNLALARALAFDHSERTPTVEQVLQGLNPNARISRRTGPGPTKSARTGWLGATAVLLATVIGVAGYLFVHRGSEHPGGAAAVPTYDQLSASVKSMLQQAKLREVDPDDPSLVEGAKKNAEAGASFVAGTLPQANALLRAAAVSINRALASGRRIAHLGNTTDEMGALMRMCREVGVPCREADFADETARVSILAPYALDPTEVTNRAFAEFVAATHYITGAEREGGLYGHKGAAAIFREGESWKTLRDAIGSELEAADYPVRGIDFNTANDYCAWRKQRLPSEEEWEFDARNLDHRLFAWGNTPRTPGASPSAHPLPAANQPPTGRFGTRGLGDGLLEWVAGGTASNRVLRGASWLDTNPIDQRLTMRRFLASTPALVDTGIRCARSVEVWPDPAQ